MDEMTPVEPLHSRPVALTPRDIQELLAIRGDRDGVDCYGLVAMVLRRMGADWPMTAGAALAAIAESQERCRHEIAAVPIARELEPAEPLQAGDVVRVDPVEGLDIPTHLAVAIGRSQLIHLTAGRAPAVVGAAAYGRALQGKGRVRVLRLAAFEGHVLGGIHCVSDGASAPAVAGEVIAGALTCPR